MAFDFESSLSDICKMPFVKVDRYEYLTSAFKKYCAESVFADLMYVGPARAGIPVEIVDKVADEVINFETLRTTSISAAAGIPGGFAMLGTIPADMAQYLGHLLIILQKLAYIYGWPDLIGDDEKTHSLIILFTGIMFGSSAANKAMDKVAKSANKGSSNQLPKAAITKTFIYPIIRQVCNFVSVKITKDIFAKSVGKIVPIVGAIVSGGLTYASFKPMAKRLKKYLKTLPQARPSNLLLKPVEKTEEFDDNFLESESPDTPLDGEVKPVQNPNSSTTEYEEDSPVKIVNLPVDKSRNDLPKDNDKLS